MFAKHKSVFEKNHLNVGMTRETAEKLLKLIADVSDFDGIKADIEDQLKPEYVYEIECRDCPTKYLYHSRTQLTVADVKRGGICSSCSDDYK